jgi:hypothetical protein
MLCEIPLGARAAVVDDQHVVSRRDQGVDDVRTMKPAPPVTIQKS